MFGHHKQDDKPPQLSFRTLKPTSIERPVHSTMPTIPTHTVYPLLMRSVPSASSSSSSVHSAGKTRDHVVHVPTSTSETRLNPQIGPRKSSMQHLTQTMNTTRKGGLFNGNTGVLERARMWGKRPSEKTALGGKRASQSETALARPNAAMPSLPDRLRHNLDDQKQSLMDANYEAFMREAMALSYPFMPTNTPNVTLMDASPPTFGVTPPMPDHAQAMIAAYQMRTQKTPTTAPLTRPNGPTPISATPMTRAVSSGTLAAPSSPTMPSTQLRVKPPALVIHTTPYQPPTPESSTTPKESPPAWLVGTRQSTISDDTFRLDLDLKFVSPESPAPPAAVVEDYRGSSLYTSSFEDMLSTVAVNDSHPPPVDTICHLVVDQYHATSAMLPKKGDYKEEEEEEAVQTTQLEQKKVKSSGGTTTHTLKAFFLPSGLRRRQPTQEASSSEKKKTSKKKKDEQVQEESKKKEKQTQKESKSSKTKAKMKSPQLDNFWPTASKQDTPDQESTPSLTNTPDPPKPVVPLYNGPFSPLTNATKPNTKDHPFLSQDWHKNNPIQKKLPKLERKGSVGSLASNRRAYLAKRATMKKQDASDITQSEVTCNVTYNAILDVIDDYHDAWLGEDEEELEQLEEERRRVLCEMIVDERKYVRILKLTIHGFLVPLRKISKRHGVLGAVFEESDVNRIFGNLETLLPLHEELLKDLRWTSANHSSIGSMEDVPLAFMKHTPHFKHHLTYLQTYTDGLVMLERLTQRNPSFRRALEECSENSGKANLRAYLGAPKDRVPRYHAFLLRMLELYSPQDPEYVGLVECIQSIECINVEVTKMIHVVEQREAVFWIQHSMVGYTENLVTETRRLVYQGEVIHVRLVDAKQEERKAFLFNDLLILARQLQDGTHEFKTKINIRGARACELQDGPKSRNMLLIKTADGEDYFIQTESPEARRRWYHHLREVTDDPSLFDGGHNQTDLGRSMLNQTTALGWSIADDVEDSVDVTHVLKSPDHTNDVHQLPFLSTSPTSLRSPSHGSSKYGMDRSNTRSSRKKSKPKAAPSFERQRAAKNGAAIFTEAGIYVTGTPTII